MTINTLVLLPGIGCDRAVWEPVLGYLPSRFAVMVPDMPGETIDAMAQAVLLQAPERFALAGHSMGGYVALAIMRQAPQRVSHLALLSTAAHSDSPKQAENRAAMIALAERDFSAAVKFTSKALIFGPAAQDSRILETITAMIHRVGQPTFLRQQRATASRPDATAGLGNIAVRTLVLTGAEDAIVAPRNSAAMASAINGAKLREIADCGHVPQIENATETGAALGQWLEN